MKTWNLDDSIANADWTKQSRDLPPYKSAEFLSIFPPEELDMFRALPVYQAAVAHGLIHDDEWVGDYVKDA